MFLLFRNLWRRLLAAPQASRHTAKQTADDPAGASEASTTVTAEQNDTRQPALTEAVAPYDIHLLERARTQWQFGDWESLAQLDRDTLQHHPNRAKLALLAADGRLQTDQIDEAKKYIRLANDWGVSKTLLARIVAAGVHNSLGRAAALSGQYQRALGHFEASIGLGTTGSEARLLTQARGTEQFHQIGLPELARSAMDLHGPIHTTGLNIDELSA